MAEGSENYIYLQSDEIYWAIHLIDIRYGKPSDIQKTCSLTFIKILKYGPTTLYKVKTSTSGRYELILTIIESELSP